MTDALRVAEEALVRARCGLDVTTQLEQLVAKLGPPALEDTPLMAAARRYDAVAGTPLEDEAFEEWAALARGQKAAGGPR